MTIEFNDTILSKYKLTQAQYLFLWALAKSEDFNSEVEELINRGFIQKTADNSYTIREDELMVLENIYLKSSKKNKKDDNYYTELAMALKELYPKGRKPGTNTMWRGNTVEIVKKLKTLEISYNFTFTFDQAVAATKRYVESFNGKYDNMRVLKYFLLKTVPEVSADGERRLTVVSDFMTFVENENQEDFDTNWMDNVR